MKFTFIGRHASFALLAFTALSFASFASAAILTWNGGGDGTSWNQAANWGGTAPGTHDTLNITTGDTITNVYRNTSNNSYQDGSTWRGIVNLNQGTINIGARFETGEGTFNIGDGVGTADSIVDVTGGFWVLDRHGNGTYNVNVKSDGQLKATGGTFNPYGGHNNRKWEINVQGGSVSSTSAWNMSDGAGNDANTMNLSNKGSVNIGAMSVHEEVIDFADQTANSFTATYGGSFANIGAVNSALGSTFTASGGGNLEATDNGTSFTVTALQLVQPGGAGTIGDETIASSSQNVALGGTAAQSTNYNSTFVAGLGIDGNTGNFTHTSAGGEPDPTTWQVALDDTYTIEGIFIHNRDNCCQGRLRDIAVEVLNFTGDLNSDFAPGSGGTVDLNTLTETGELIKAGNVQNPLAGVTYVGTDPDISIDTAAMSGSAATGNFVRIMRTHNGGSTSHDNEVLSLGEVEVWATIPGDFTLLDGSTLEIELDAIAGTADMLSVEDMLTIEPGSTLDVSVLSGEIGAGQEFDILDFGGITGTFDTINLPGSSSDWDLSNLYVTGVIAPIVPEPSTFILAALGMLGLIAFGRRRKK